MIKVGDLYKTVNGRIVKILEESQTWGDSVFKVEFQDTMEVEWRSEYQVAQWDSLEDVPNIGNTNNKCLHKNVKKVRMVYTEFRLCTDCKQDLGDA